VVAPRFPALRWTLYALATLWAAGAIYVDGPLRMHQGNGWLALAWLAVTVVCLALIRRIWLRRVTWLVCFLTVLIPWLGITASNDRVWQPRWAKTAWIEIDGAKLTFHNFRNFDYKPNGTVVRRWLSRTADLANLRGMDYIQSNFGGELIAHSLLSFDFGPDGRIALSVETRREAHESFSEIGGLYKMFELAYVWGDEADLVRLRTNVEREPVRLYRTSLGPTQTLFVLLDAVRETNWLSEHPRFYNLLTANCTTSLYAQTLEFRNTPFDYRMLANGKLDELIYEMGGFRTDELAFEALRERSEINGVALAAQSATDFSDRIRADRPGFDQQPRSGSRAAEQPQALSTR